MTHNPYLFLGKPTKLDPRLSTREKRIGLEDAKKYPNHFTRAIPSSWQSPIDFVQTLDRLRHYKPVEYDWNPDMRPGHLHEAKAIRRALDVVTVTEEDPLP